MVIVTALVSLPPEKVDEALALSLQHVARSRTEPGCISHQVFRDVEDPERLFFYECWADRPALEAHFAVPESRAFARALSGLATTTPRIDVHSVEVGLT